MLGSLVTFAVWGTLLANVAAAPVAKDTSPNPAKRQDIFYTVLCLGPGTDDIADACDTYCNQFNGRLQWNTSRCNDGGEYGEIIEDNCYCVAQCVLCEK